MSIQIVDKIGDVKIYGGGLLGGKGEGLLKINECRIPIAHKLRTRILTTAFFESYRKRDGQFGPVELETLTSILGKLGDIPISVRSSATNEAFVGTGGDGSVHAGENTSFMLPNNHPDFAFRFNQLIQAVYFIYEDFIRQQTEDSRESMAIVINPIPGRHDSTLAGPVYYPLLSGVANSFFFHALKTQDPEEGFARIAFGHGYATVLDDFPVLSMATIRNPLPVRMMGEGQKYFYALDMAWNQELSGEELETMKKLHIRFVTFESLKSLGVANNLITFEELVQKDHYKFRSDLCTIMGTISAEISSHFQIEFVFNLDPGQRDRGTFHVVQLTQLPEIKFEIIDIPDIIKKTYLATTNLQGHGIRCGIRYAVVVSPFMYSKDRHDAVRKKLSEINRRMKKNQANYITIVPGRLGSNNRDWGIQADFKDVDGTCAIFEYGVDIAGRSEPVPEETTMSGGVYGSHFLYVIQGGMDEEKRRIQTRMYGTQGTHFLTNLVSNNIIYGYITPGISSFDPWFFTPPGAGEVPYVLTFPHQAVLYADSKSRRCILVPEGGGT